MSDLNTPSSDLYRHDFVKKAPGSSSDSATMGLKFLAITGHDYNIYPPWLELAERECSAKEHKRKVEIQNVRHVLPKKSQSGECLGKHELACTEPLRN